MRATISVWLDRTALRIAAWLVTRVTVNRTGFLRERVVDVATNEINDLPAIIREAVTFQKTEQQILSDRLGRSYDLGMALNESANRAIAQKQKAKQEAAGIMPLTDRQQMAFEYQKQYLQKIVRES